jgi:predicted nucleic acid-binding protein
LSVCYLDASALVKLATAEPETQALRNHLAQSAIRITSRLATVEVARALRRRGHDSRSMVGEIAKAFEGLAVLELDESLATTAGGVEPATLRSLDAVHLASALSLGVEETSLITYDLRLADAARAAGLEVVAPA